MRIAPVFARLHAKLEVRGLPVLTPETGVRMIVTIFRILVLEPCPILRDRNADGDAATDGAFPDEGTRPFVIDTNHARRSPGCVQAVQLASLGLSGRRHGSCSNGGESSDDLVLHFVSPSS
jgi:hypothetical protein